MPEVQPDPNRPLRVIGRYALYGKLATGGMATVHFGRLLGPVGFSRTVAIKRLHPQFAKDREFVDMFLDEARLAARIQHPNVVATVDVVAMEQELFLVMDYVRGEAFSRILRAAKRKGIQLPEGFIASVVSGMLHGLHAAHEATDERGRPLQVVHRDVSPQNVLVGVDGVPRVLDFGVAKAAARVQVTRDGQMKGKLSYMSPEQLQGRRIDRRSDVFAAGIVLWEALTGERLFAGEDATGVLNDILTRDAPRPSQVNPKLRPEVDAIVLKALEKDPDARYATSREFAIAIEEGMQLLSPREVGEWVEEVAGDSLELRETALAEIESISAVGHLSAFNDSDPQLLRTLKDSFTAHAAQAAGVRPVPAPRSDDEATTIYHGPANQSLDPLPGDDPTLVFHNVEELTQPGRNAAAGFDNPFASPEQKKKRVLIVAGGILAVLLLVGLIAGLSGDDDAPHRAEGEDAPAQVEGELPRASAPREPGAGQSGDVVASGKPEPDALPKQGEPTGPGRPDEAPGDEAPTEEARAEEARADEAPAERAPRSKRRSDVEVGGPSNLLPKTNPVNKPKPGCAKPWTIDENGIRRVKPECL